MMALELVYGAKFFMQPPDLDCLRHSVTSYMRSEEPLTSHQGEATLSFIEIFSFVYIFHNIYLKLPLKELVLEHCQVE